ncbi:MAG: MarR family transcriptional regulator [Sulfuritalea sp.]|nr:MarR family transcriptional regulator [Sulfuritalea sp.]
MSGKEKPGDVVKSKRKLTCTQTGGTETAAAEEAFSKVLQLVRVVQLGMQNIDPSHGLSGSQLWALWHISAHPGQRVSELASTLHIHLSTASNLLDKLETRGLIRRERRDADNRVVRLYLAEPGLELVKGIPGPMQGHLRRALRDVPAPVLDGLIEGVGAVLDLMGEAPDLNVA